MQADGTLAAVIDQLRETVTSRLRRVHQRLTPNRAAIVDVLASSSRPITIPELLDVSDGLAQSSVYRNLVVLEQAGVVHRIVTNDEFARFELAEDLTEHHHHLVCVECGKVIDVTPSAEFEQDVATTLDALAASEGFEPHSHRLDVLGLCETCR
jgi:Fur family transcriptional regulator, ferric uptake regulator